MKETEYNDSLQIVGIKHGWTSVPARRPGVGLFPIGQLAGDILEWSSIAAGQNTFLTEFCVLGW